MLLRESGRVAVPRARRCPGATTSVGVHRSTGGAPKSWRIHTSSGQASASPSNNNGPVIENKGAGLTINGYSPTSPQAWAEISSALKAAGLKVISAQEVKFAVEKGMPVIDIRPSTDHEEGHIPGSVNVTYYRPIMGWSPKQTARRLGYALFGVLNGTEINPNFDKEVDAATGGQRDAPLVLYCSQGGSLEPTEQSKSGQQTRSLIAAFQLLQAGYTNLQVLKGGFKEWESSGRDIAIIEYVETPDF